ncbi:MBL fold metallo-hydrolase [Leucobacter coleopterorum]|uniref:MBL fold metallo-hydrolase n=2 Tax=Leucobacter coleopterorum TaxID=2714933 RepID=A0ABX6JZH7_9MICO|nr:MBL fold metallo-hydrolase [Leucobacter coleopterorum]
MCVTVVRFTADTSKGFGERFWVRARLHAGRGDIPVLLWLDGKPDQRWVPGATLQIAGQAELLEAGSSAAFGITVGDAAGANPLKPERRSIAERAGEAASELRLRLRDATRQFRGAELLPGFAVGDTSLVSEELRDQMLESSLTHLTAVSGSNCALATSSVLWVSSMLGAGRRVRSVLAVLALTGFVFLVGPDPSVQRAAIMAAVVLISGYGGKQAHALPSLGAAVLLLLSIDPWQALQPGFALSVVATGGILVAAPTLHRGLNRTLKIPRFLALPLAVVLAAQIVCGPLLLLLQPGLPMAGVLANVIAAPAAPLGTGFGLLAMLVLPVSEPLGMTLMQIGAVSARWVAATAEICANLPLSRWAWPEGWGGALLLTAVQAAPVLAWALYTGRLKTPMAVRAKPRSPWQQSPSAPRGVRLAVAVLMCGASGVFLGPTLITPSAEHASTPRGWAIVACDVGQGDAILLRDPESRDSTILVDTGDDPELVQECLTRFSVKRISLLVLTHDDADHVGALSAIADRVEAAIVSPPSVGNGDEDQDATGRNSRRLLQDLEREGIPYRVAVEGLSGSLGGAEWTVLYPQQNQVPLSTNAASIVMRVEVGGISALLLGDTGEQEHRRLLTSGVGLEADVIKVAHHGSRDQHSQLVAAINAKIGLISVGEENRYGHPTDSALDALRNAGTTALRTDQLGSIALSKKNGDIRAWSVRAPADVGGEQ